MTIGDDNVHPKKVVLPQKSRSAAADQISLKWNQVYFIGAGLHNLGNTCFLNAALQCLTYTPPLTNYMLSREHSKTCHRSGFCMMCIMQDHITHVFANSGRVVKPTGVLSALKRIAEHFEYGRQEDAHEFLRCTLEAMLKSGLPANEVNSPVQAAAFVHQVFGGCFRSRVKCLTCKAVFDTFDPFLDVALEIKTAPSIIEALKQFVKLEELDGENAYKCMKCNKMVAALKRFTIHRGSDVLTIFLNRFANYYGDKITKDVRYPEYLDIRPFMSQSDGEPLHYLLYAVLVHTGSNCYSGHYYCYVKASDGQWYQMNDASVTISDIRTVLNQQAYILFYISMGILQNQPHISDGSSWKMSACSKPSSFDLTAASLLSSSATSQCLSCNPGVLKAAESQKASFITEVVNYKEKNMDSRGNSRERDRLHESDRSPDVKDSDELSRSCPTLCWSAPYPDLTSQQIGLRHRSVSFTGSQQPLVTKMQSQANSIIMMAASLLSSSTASQFLSCNAEVLKAAESQEASFVTDKEAPYKEMDGSGIRGKERDGSRTRETNTRRTMYRDRSRKREGERQERDGKGDSSSSSGNMYRSREKEPYMRRDRGRSRRREILRERRRDRASSRRRERYRNRSSNMERDIRRRSTVQGTAKEHSDRSWRRKKMKSRRREDTRSPCDSHSSQSSDDKSFSPKRQHLNRELSPQPGKSYGFESALQTYRSLEEDTDKDFGGSRRHKRKKRIGATFLCREWLILVKQEH